MPYTGINQGSVKNSNRSAILKLLNDQGAMSRKDIAAALGLTAASVTMICSEMIASQVLCELGEAQEDIGKLTNSIRKAILSVPN